MAKNIKGGKWSSKASRLGAGLSLEKFSKAKQSSFDRRKAKKDKHKALKAAKVNKYRKLKERLRTEGRLQPVLPTSITVGPRCSFILYAAAFWHPLSALDLLSPKQEETGEGADTYGDSQRALARCEVRSA